MAISLLAQNLKGNSILLLLDRAAAAAFLVGSDGA